MRIPYPDVCIIAATCNACAIVRQAYTPHTAAMRFNFLLKSKWHHGLRSVYVVEIHFNLCACVCVGGWVIYTCTSTYVILFFSLKVCCACLCLLSLSVCSRLELRSCNQLALVDACNYTIFINTVRKDRSHKVCGTNCSNIVAQSDKKFPGSTH